ncbi:MAG: DUF177 domain-containing protein [Oscillospiraceae bacterium]|nr:DUF177 domain-containing protein [Oscillospiraceae bacterium]
MQIRLEQIFNNDGASKDIDFSFEPDYSLADDFRLTTPVSFKGIIKNSAGVVSLSGKAQFTASFICGRCAEDFKRNFSVTVSHLLTDRLNNEDNGDYIVVENSELDLSALICEDIIFSLPTRLLCREDCKGLCPQCGKNLNEGACDCTKPVDPRWAALSGLSFD